MGCANYFLEFYGIPQFIADIDAAREYNAGSIFDCILDCISTRKFAETFKDADIKYGKSPLQFRQRFILEAIENGGFF